MLTAVMIAAQLAGLTRLDLPLLLGTMVMADPDRRARRRILHSSRDRRRFRARLRGRVCAARYRNVVAWCVVRVGACQPRADGSRPAATGYPPAHGVGPGRAGLVAVLEPPGLFGLNYGVETPVVAVLSHLAFGIALGLLLTAH